MKKTDKIDLRLWPFKVLVEGHHAIAALRWAAGDGARRHGCIVGDVVLAARSSCLCSTDSPRIWREQTEVTVSERHRIRQ
jgi:hypothetical protein